MSVSIYLRNDAGKRGVPLKRSFLTWVNAIPQLRRRRADVNILVVDASQGRRYNRQFRRKDHPTNVLSFAYEPLPGEKTTLLGDLVICAPIVAREAAEQGKRVRDHYAHLTVHGVLHLIGYDHQIEPEAQRMEALERRILAGLGITDPY